MKNTILFTFILLFISSCIKPGVIKYPEQGKTGDNILSLNQTVYSGQLSMTAFLNKKTDLKVDIESLNNSSTITSEWIFDLFDGFRWKPLVFENKKQSFEVFNIPGECHMPFTFLPGKYLITISEDNETATRVKEIEVK